MELTRIKLGSTEDCETVWWKSRETHGGCYGKTGTGKSTMMLNGIEADSYEPYSQIILDPAGELGEDSYSILKNRGKKVHFLSLDTPSVSLNLMRLPYEPHIISSIATECINQTISVLTPNNPLTSMMSNINREAINYCLEHNLSNLQLVRDQISNHKGHHEAKDGLLGRYDYILNDPKMNRILCGENSITISELIRKQESLVISCKRQTPEQRVFLGTLITQLVAAYMDYEATVKSKPLAFWIDEAHLFVRDSFLDVLKRIRKFHVSVAMATQDFASVSEKIRRVMLNVGTVVSFRIGHSEACHLAREFDCKPQDLQFLEKYRFGFLTDDKRGFGKALRPPLIKKRRPGKLESKEMKTQGEWFDLPPGWP